MSKILNYIKRNCAGWLIVLFIGIIANCISIKITGGNKMVDSRFLWGTLFFVAYNIGLLYIGKLVYFKKWRKQLEKENEEKINQKADQKFQEKLIELENEDMITIKDEFKRVSSFLMPLLNPDASGYCFYHVFNDAGKNINGLFDLFTQKILDLSDNFQTFLNHLEESTNFEGLRDELNQNILRRIENLCRDFGKRKNEWSDKYDKVIMDNLIEEYTIFINELKVFYKNYGLDTQPFFRYISSFLRGC